MTEPVRPLEALIADMKEIRSACGFMWMRMAVAKDAQDAYDIAKREFEEHQEAFKRLETSLPELAALLQAAAPPADDPFEQLRQRQRDLPPDAAKVLMDNLWELYEGTPITAAPPAPAARGAVHDFVKPERYRFDQVLQIAGLVNAYHNDASALTAAETLKAIADVLGPAMGMSAPPAPTAERQVAELEWVLKRAEEIVGYEHDRDAAYAFTQAWGELPKELSAAPPERVSEGKEP